MTAAWLKGCHQALNMATASRLRISVGASVNPRIFSPSSHSSDRSRFGWRVPGGPAAPGPPPHPRGPGHRAPRASPRARNRAPRAPARRSPWRSRGCRWRDPCGGGRRRPFELLEIRFNGGLHVGVLQLAGERLALLRGRAMNLAERGGGGGVEIEGAEPALPAGAQLGLHAPLDEGGPHGRRLALELLQLGGVFRRDEVRDGGEKLRHLHDRPLEAAERLGQHRRVGGLAPIDARKAWRRPCARRPRPYWRPRGHSGRRARGEAVRFAVGIGHDQGSLCVTWKA